MKNTLQTVEPKNFYSYFLDCYKLDYKEFVIDNILSTKFKHKWFAKGTEELFSGNLPYTLYDNKKVMELERDMELYKLEKKLFYGCFFVLGKSNNPLVRDKRFCAPLLLFPAKIVTEDDEKFIDIELDSFQVNRSVLTKLELSETAKDKDDFLEQIHYIIGIQNGHLDLMNLLKSYFSNLDVDALLDFPNLWTRKKIIDYFSNNELSTTEFKIIPSAGSVFVEKAESSLRVINDLTEIVKQNTFNSSLKELFKEQAIEHSFKESFFKHRLNTQQYKALKNVNRFNNSVIVGPPGTGKTYTLTSIVTDAVANGQSVLVVSKTKPAVEVLRKMLEKEFRLKNYLIHTTGKRYEYSLTVRISNFLNGILTNKTIELYNDKIVDLKYHFNKSVQEFEKAIQKELKISDLEFDENLSILKKLEKWYLNITNDGRHLWESFNQMNASYKKLNKEVNIVAKKQIEQNIAKSASRHRKDLSLFYDAIKADNFTEYKEILEQVNYENILHIFPIWLANLSDLNSVIPLKKDLFDLVVIDEATQCDIATALPAIYRAKRVVIAGDPNQLRHYSFVSYAQQDQLKDKYELPRDKIFDYRNRSVLDLYISKLQSQEQLSFLTEHFRSTPSLIEFSNQTFYDGKLEVLKSTPKHTAENQIEIININGTRDKKGVNEQEANAILKKLDQLIEQYKEEEKNKPSIGIIAMFANQVVYINKLLRDKYDLSTIRKFNLLCGTPYQFQGSEREIILLSFVVCNNTHSSAMIHANKAEVLNVAITRAKSFQYIFKSIDKKNLNKDSLIYEYFDFIENYSYSTQINPTLDQFQEEIIEELNRLDYKEIQTGYPVAGTVLDILVHHNHKDFFIDLIGYPGDYKEAIPLEKYRTLSRVGIHSYPIHYSQWKDNKKLVIRKLIQFLR